MASIFNELMENFYLQVLGLNVMALCYVAFACDGTVMLHILLSSEDFLSGLVFFFSLYLLDFLSNFLLRFIDPFPHSYSIIV